MQQVLGVHPVFRCKLTKVALRVRNVSRAVEKLAPQWLLNRAFFKLTGALSVS